MKKRLINTFQYISISYTMILTVTALTNIAAHGPGSGVRSVFLLQVFLLLSAYWGIEALTDELDFFQKIKPAVYVAAHICIEYALYLIFSIFFNWYGITLKNLLLYSFLFILIEMLARNAFYRKNKAAEEEINRLIARKSDSN